MVEPNSGLVVVSLEAVSKTVSGGFPLTRVRIPPPPFFGRISLVYRRNGLAGLLRLTRERRVSERQQTTFRRKFIPSRAQKRISEQRGRFWGSGRTSPSRLRMRQMLAREGMSFFCWARW